MKYIIKSKKFILRPFKKGDEKSLIDNINDKDIYRYTLRIPHPYKKKDAKKWIEYCINESRKKIQKEIVFAIDIDGEVIGAIGFHNIEKNHKAEIGYWLGKNNWNKGIITESAGLVTEFGFKELKLKRIYAPIFVQNKASARVLEKNGYKFEGLAKNYHLKEGRLIDVFIYAKVK